MRLGERGRAWVGVAWIVAAFAVLLGVVGFVLVDAGADTLADGGRFTGCARRGPTASGETPRWRCTVVYEFGERTITQSVTRRSASDPTGDRIDVYVDPGDPTRHSLGRSASEARTIWLVVAGAGGAAALGLAGYHLWSRRRSSWLPT